MRTCLLALFLTCLLLASCRRSEPIQTYRVAKPSRQAAAGTSASQKEIEWKTPLGWKEQPPSAMRTASFLIKGRNGQTAEVSIIPLSGEAGGALANINRWRGQINLGPIAEKDLTDNSQMIDLGGKSMLWINFVSQEPLVDQRYRKRIMAAVYELKTRTWFFKLMGEDQTVEEARPAFIEFLKTLRIHEPAS